MEKREESRAVVGRGYLVFVIAVFMLINTIKVADRELLNPLFGPISDKTTGLGLNDLHMGIIRAATDLSLVVGAIALGLLADRWRRRDVVGIAVLCWSAITWVTGQVRSFGQLLAARASMTFFQAAFGTAAYPMVSDLVPRRSRGGVMGLLSATFALGTILALGVTGLMGTQSWRRYFGLFGIPGLLLGLLVFAFIREPRRGAAEDEVMEAGIYTGRFSWKSLKRTLSIRTALLVFLLDAFQGSTWWAFSFWAPTYLDRTKIASSPDAAALALLPAIVGFIVGAILGGWAIDRIRRRTERAAVWVALVSMVGALAMSVLVFALTNLNAVMVAGFFLGLFGYLVMPTINVLLYEVVPPETRSSAGAADGVTLSIVSAATALVIGGVSQYLGTQQGLELGNLRASFQATVTVLLSLGILVSLLLLRTVRRDMAALREYVAQRAAAAPEA